MDGRKIHGILDVTIQMDLNKNIIVLGILNIWILKPQMVN
jgi:hypothetical protein